ncbi:peptidase [Ornithinimicrobium cerasi]|uniref:peptidase n=1 Tax=Ornithinimicrobium cerasi TaxID=2248773 RepID=UPI000EFF9FAD|nr:peptidase [Ornithinimicrobium cerasi]
MPDRGGPPVEVAPLHRGGELAGFVLIGRWPEDTLEWAQVLLLAVQVAAVPGMLPRGSTVFRVAEDLPGTQLPGAVGIVVAEGLLVGEQHLSPGRFADRTPAGLAVLHPPDSTVASVPEYRSASGCILLPGLPELGLDHRAAWVEADAQGHVTRLASKAMVDPLCDADTAALALLLVA